MKKAAFIIIFTLLIEGASLAQDSTKSTSIQHNTISSAKNLHHKNSMSEDSSNYARLTHSNGKVCGNPSSQMKTSKKHRKSSAKISTDSTKK